MAYLLTYYPVWGGRYDVQLDKLVEGDWDRVVRARMTAAELKVFIETCRKLDPQTEVEETRWPNDVQAELF